MNYASSAFLYFQLSSISVLVLEVFKTHSHKSSDCTLQSWFYPRERFCDDFTMLKKYLKYFDSPSYLKMCLDEAW